MFGIRPTPTERREKMLSFILCLHACFYKERICSRRGLYERCSGLTERLSMFLWLKHATSIATLFSENLGERSIPSDHAAVRGVIHKTDYCGHQGKRTPSWMCKHPVFFILETDQRRSLTPCRPVRCSRRMPETGPFASFCGRHRAAWEPSS